MQWRVVAGLALTLVVATVQAGPSPQGRWQTIDDKTGKAKSVVELQVSGEGQLSGRVVELLNHPGQDNPLCEACEGERHAQPIKGMTILWGLRADENGHWVGGQVLDPAKGEVYKAKVSLDEDGQQLHLRGFIGIEALGRTQTWRRLAP